MSERAQAVVRQSPSGNRGASLATKSVVLLAAIAALAAATPAFAQDADAPKEAPLKADFKGAVGCGMLGAELGFVIPALAGAKGWWPYVVFPVLGAGGGAVGGYFALEKGDGHPELAVGALTLGMALVVPAMVATIAATSYRPPEEIQGANAKRMRALAQSGDGLVRWSGESLALAPPAITVAESQSARQALRTGTSRTSTMRVSLLSGRF